MEENTQIESSQNQVDQQQIGQLSTQNEQQSKSEPVVNEEKNEVNSKTFTQEEVDEIIRKRLAREARKFEKNQREQVNYNSSQANPEKSQFNSEEDYLEALAEVKANKKIAEMNERSSKAKIDDKFSELEESMAEKFDDYFQVTRNQNLKVTEAMADAIKESDVGHEVLYFLGTNPKESAKIASMPILQQIKEIGKLEDRLSKDPISAKKASKAPEPINPVKNKTEVKEYDLDDPRSLKELGTSEWIRRDRERQMKKLTSKS